MEKKEKLNENVISFSQSKTKTKQFRSSHPLSHNLRSFLLNEIHVDFLNYLTENYLLDHYEVMQEFGKEHYVKEEKELSLIYNLFWWRILYDLEDQNINHVNDYIAENKEKFRKRPLITSWLREWEKAIPSFYYVGHIYNDQVFVVVDTRTLKTFDVVIYDTNSFSPKSGEIVMGTLLPIGDGLYFPITDFYHFELAANKDIASNLNHYYDKNLQSFSLLQTFIHVLSAALQIEHIISLEQLQK